MRHGLISLLGSWWRRDQGELEACRRELSESLERETATSQVLGIISSSPSDLQPVFETILANATRLCEASYGTLWLCEGDATRVAALHGALPAQFAAERQRGAVFRLGAGAPSTRAVRTRQTVHVTDMRAEQAYLDRDPRVVTGVELGGVRTFVAVPMLKENQVVGVITMYRQEVRPFTDNQIALVTSFASQAVIAIENARLLNELRESLDQQTATSDVLRVISRSPTDLASVFDTILINATRLCEGNFAGLWQYDGEALVGVGQHNVSPGFAELCRNTKIQLGRAGPVRKAALERRTIHVADITVEPGFSPIILQYENARTVLAVPLLREKDLVGVVGIWRREVRPFTEQQIALVRTFADQAVVAIENARLFDEVQARSRELSESLEQQTATADVLKVISRSKFELQPVLDTLVESATRLCEAKDAYILLRDGELYRVGASYGFSPEAQEYLEQNPISVDRGSVVGRTVLTGELVHVPDVLADPEYTRLDVQKISGYRAALGAPLLREGNAIGVIFVARTVPEPFTAKQIELVSTFADQVVIAIENVRLFDEVQARNRELTEALEQQTATSEILRVISRSPTDLV